MRAQLVTAVVAGLLATPLAQAQTEYLTLYGRLNLDVELVNGKQAGAHAGMFRRFQFDGPALQILIQLSDLLLCLLVPGFYGLQLLDPSA